MIEECDQIQSNQQTKEMEQEFLDFIPYKGFKFHQEQYRNQLLYSKLLNPAFLNFQPPTIINHQQQQKPVNKPISLKLTVQFASYNVIVSQRKFLESKCDILLVPYETPQLQIYPGNVLKPNLLSSIQKLIDLNPKLGDLYLKKSSISQYSYLGFIKLGLVDPLRQLTIGINSIFSKMKQINKQFQTMSLIYDKRYDIEKLIKLLMSEIQNGEQQTKKSIELVVEDGIIFQKCNSIISSLNAELK